MHKRVALNIVDPVDNAKALCYTKGKIDKSMAR